MYHLRRDAPQHHAQESPQPVAGKEYQIGIGLAREANDLVRWPTGPDEDATVRARVTYPFRQFNEASFSLDLEAEAAIVRKLRIVEVRLRAHRFVYDMEQVQRRTMSRGQRLSIGKSQVRAPGKVDRHEN